MRLQLVLVLLSGFHQSVYSGITAYIQEQAYGPATTAKVSEDGEVVMREIPPITGYFLCNKRYAEPVWTALSEVLSGPQLRPVTAQCCLYIMRYLLTNHIYGDVMPFTVLETLGHVYALCKGYFHI